MYDLLCLFCTCSLHCCLCSFLDSGTFQCGNLNHLTSKYLRQFVDEDLVTVFLDNVHHVDCHHHRNTKFCQLSGKIQVTLQVGSVYNVQDCIRALVNQISSGYNLLQCIGRQRIDTRKVHDDNIIMTF